MTTSRRVHEANPATGPTRAVAEERGGLTRPYTQLYVIFTSPISRRSGWRKHPED